MDDATARQLLDDERARIEGEIERLSASVQRDAERGAEPQDRADSAQIDYGQAQDMAKIEHLRDQLAAVERAEERLASGTFGLSIESGEPIGDGRLRRIPTAERTAQEQTAFERRGGV